MSHQPDDPLTPEEQEFDQFLDSLVRSSGGSRPRIGNDLEQFAAAVFASEPAMTSEQLRTDPVLNHLLASQRRLSGDPAGQSNEASNQSGQGLSRKLRKPKSTTSATPAAYPVPASVGGGSTAWWGTARIPFSIAALLVLGIATSLLYTTYFNNDGNKRVAGPLGLIDKMASTATEFSVEPIGSAATPSPMLAVTIDGVEIKINSCELIDVVETNLTNEEPLRDKFLALSVTVTNMSGPGDIRFAELAVQDDINEPYLLDLYATLLANDVIMLNESFANIELEPGEPHDVYLVFDVFTGSSTLRFTDQEGSFTLLLPEVCVND